MSKEYKLYDAIYIKLYKMQYNISFKGRLMAFQRTWKWPVSRTTES